MKKLFILGVLAALILIIGSTVMAAQDTIPGEYSGRAEYNRAATQRGYTAVEMTIYQKEGDVYLGEMSLEKINKRGKVKGKKYIVFKVKPDNGKLMMYRKSGNEFMTLSINNSSLEGTYHLAAVYMGAIEFKQIVSNQKPTPTNIREKFASLEEEEDEE
jgi:hypothetical protein